MGHWWRDRKDKNEVNYYRRYCGDYLRDTAHLTLMEHGVYNILLDHQYATEKPIPERGADLYRLCRATTKAERLAVDGVVRQFFPKCDGGRGNPRALRQIPEERARIDSAKTNGGKGGRPRKNPEETQRLTAGLANQNPELTQAQSSPSPSPSLKEKERTLASEQKDERALRFGARAHHQAEPTAIGSVLPTLRRTA